MHNLLFLSILQWHGDIFDYWWHTQSQCRTKELIIIYFSIKIGGTLSTVIKYNIGNTCSFKSIWHPSKLFNKKPKLKFE